MGKSPRRSVNIFVAQSSVSKSWDTMFCHYAVSSFLFISLLEAQAAAQQKTVEEKKEEEEEDLSLAYAARG